MRKNANHGSTQFYLLIAIVLGVITFFEFAFVEWQGLLFNNDGLILWSLYILSIVKFFLVVMFFMHLYGDHKILTQLFTAGMVVGSITVAIMLMLFTADNMNRYKVEQPVSAHGAEHGGGHGDAHGPIEIPERSLAETLARPAPKSQQFALAPRESLDAGSLNLPSISLPSIDQGILPAGNSSMEPAIVERVLSTVVTTQPVVSQPVVEEVQVVETVTTEVAPVTTAVVAPTVETVTTAVVAPTVETVTTTTTTEVMTAEAAEDTDLATLRAQVEALRLELEAMENALPAEAATTTTVQAIQAAPVETTTVTTPVITETVTTTVTQAAPISAETAAIATTAAATVGAAAATISASTTPAVTGATTETVTTEVVPETTSVETVSVSFDTELGNSAYMGNCLACHQMTGEGIPGAFPPLKGHITELYNAEGGRDYLVQVVLYGLQGQINAGGMTYNGMMTAFGNLDDDTIAAILNHELTSWGNDALANDFSPITAEEVAVQRATPLTPQEVLANRVIQ